MVYVSVRHEWTEPVFKRRGATLGYANTSLLKLCVRFDFLRALNYGMTDDPGSRKWRWMQIAAGVLAPAGATVAWSEWPAR
jgi:hypothetical protein